MPSLELYGQMALRLAAALVLCGLVGLQRAASGKPAGVRTHGLVGLGAAGMTLASAYAFPDLPGAHDPTRIAAQIVSGIGFIGGGMILKEGVTVRGLTTAASLWAVTGVGIAAGAGLLPLAALITTFSLIALGLLGRADEVVPQQQRTVWTLSCVLSDASRLAVVLAILRDRSAYVHVVGFQTAADGQGTTVTLELASPRRFDIVEATTTLKANGVQQAQWKAESFGEAFV